MDIIHIDGAQGEGGGQIVRTSLSLSAITGQPFSLHNIRAGRENPGLRAQHITAIRAAAAICHAQVQGAEIGSRTLSFGPVTAPQAGCWHWEVETAGAVTLILQTVLWPLALADGTSEITLVGGTHVAWSPPVDYIQTVYLPRCRELGLDASLEIEQWGWYPHGGGVIRASINGSTQLRGLVEMERGSLRSVSVLSAVSNLPDHIRQRQAQHADMLLRKQGIKPGLAVASPPSPGQGTAVYIAAEYRHSRAGFTGYGRIRKPAEKVAEEACKAFERYHKRQMPIDEHLADQLLIPCALAKGASHYAVESITQHLLTNAWVIRQFLDVDMTIDGIEKKPGTVHVGAAPSDCTPD